MYQLLNLTTGETFEVDKPRYVKRRKNGTWIQCEDYDAECVAINGERFSIANKEKVDDAPEVVAVNQIDGAQLLAQINVDAIRNAKDIQGLQEAMIEVVNEIVKIYREGLD